MSNKLYEPCQRNCKDGRMQSVNQYGISISYECDCKGTKFVEIGITVNQVERLAMKAQAFDRIAKHIKKADLVELGIASDRLKSLGHTLNSGFAVDAQEALAAISMVIKGATGPLESTSKERNG